MNERNKMKSMAGAIEAFGISFDAATEVFSKCMCPYKRCIRGLVTSDFGVLTRMPKPVDYKTTIHINVTS